MSETVLLVEDGPSGLGIVETLRIFGYKVMWAKTLDEGFEFFRNNPKTWACVIMDGCVDSASHDSLPLLQEIHASYDGPKVAASDREEVQREQAPYCTHQARSKVDVLTVVMELLGLTWPARAA